MTAEPLRKLERNSSNGSSSLAEVARWRAARNTTDRNLREVIKNDE
jgi:hypothetical protein